MARAFAVLGTGSDVGKSLITAGLCRLLHRTGVRVAPFKAQNMSLNSFVTSEGGEIGRAQALQAEACGLAPHVDMNPILLKPESDNCSQVVVQGKVCGKQTAVAYFAKKQQLWSVVKDSYQRLARRYDVILIEGAGSAAEMNLRDRDLVNWPVVRLADARVLLVADIDRGGVFAQVLGTLDLLEPEERAKVCGIIVNKFLGDASLFDDGVQFLESRSGVPVLGVVPFLRDLILDQEDSVDVRNDQHRVFSPDHVNIAVILLPHMSNFTDFNVLSAEPDVVLTYVSTPDGLAGADIVVLPGSKNTLADLSYVRTRGFEAVLRQHVECRREVIGICGGYQMLGRKIADPHGVEQGGESLGLGYLNVETELDRAKRTTQVEASPTDVRLMGRSIIHGYHIHMGVTSRGAEAPCFRIHQGSLVGEAEFDGAMRTDGLVWGTYIHGLFDEPGFRRVWLNRVRERKGLPPLEILTSKSVTTRLQRELDRWADHLSCHVDVSPLLRVSFP